MSTSNQGGFCGEPAAPGDASHLIRAVEHGSIAEELELEPGDRLISINGQAVEDVFDYQYHINSESMVMLVEKPDGEQWELDIEHGGEDLGLTFENSLMSEYRSCCNRCMFCFIDQMPPGMRETLYFKDDDSRLSFLQGNYITLTNMKEKDLERVIRFRLSPINISVHTTNPQLRCQMLNNRFAGEALGKLRRLYEAGIGMNGQVVLCRGVNDGEELERTIRDLSRYLPHMGSLSVVPAGATRFREGLADLAPFTREDAGAVIDRIERWQRRLFADHGVHFVHASDEFYILAGRPMPEEGRYDGYPQLENGVGMVRLLLCEVEEALRGIEGDNVTDELSIATGRLAHGCLSECLEAIRRKFPGRRVRLYPIRNDFFGETITVAGLITGEDIMGQLKGKELGSRLLLPECMFRSGEEVFLDDVTREEVERALQVPVNIVKSSGYDLVRAVTGAERGPQDNGYRGYEPKENEYE